MAKGLWKIGSTLLHPFGRPFLSPLPVKKVQVAGLKFYYPKDPVDKSEWPEFRRLRQVLKQPTYHFKTPKMFKMIKLMRGPEPVHNQLIYKGFGVKALLGGRMKYEHFETVRRIVNRNLDLERMFAIWRIDDPWQPLSKRGTGKRLGGGKGSIHHYCTPVKAERIIVELCGDLHALEAEKILRPITEVLPFPARFVTQEDLEREKQQEEWISKHNLNPYDMEYVIRNNMGGCQKWLSKYDYEWFGKYK